MQKVTKEFVTYCDCIDQVRDTDAWSSIHVSSDLSILADCVENNNGRFREGAFDAVLIWFTNDLQGFLRGIP